MKKPASVRVMLHASIAGNDAARSHKVVHASDLTYSERQFCPREIALFDLTNKGKPDEFIPTSLRVTFDYGDFLQWMINNKYLRKEMWGDWKCLSCGTQLPGPVRCPKVKCARAKKLKWLRCRWEYRETRAWSETTGTSSGLDMLFLDGKKLRIVEIKSMVKDDFKALQAPVAEHGLRTKMYLRIVAEDKNLNHEIHTDYAHLLYVCKGYGIKDDLFHQILKNEQVSDWPFTPYKEWLVKRDDAAVLPYLKMARAVKKFRDGGSIPKGICSTAMTKRARSCSVCKECFSGKFHS